MNNLKDKLVFASALFCCLLVLAVQVSDLTAGLPEKVNRQISRLNHGSSVQRTQAARRLGELNDGHGDTCGAKQHATDVLLQLQHENTAAGAQARRSLRKDAVRSAYSPAGNRVRNSIQSQANAAAAAAATAGQAVDVPQTQR